MLSLETFEKLKDVAEEYIVSPPAHRKELMQTISLFLSDIRRAAKNPAVGNKCSEIYSWFEELAKSRNKNYTEQSLINFIRTDLSVIGNLLDI